MDNTGPIHETPASSPQAPRERKHSPKQPRADEREKFDRAMDRRAGASAGNEARGKSGAGGVSELFRHAAGNLTGRQALSDAAERQSGEAAAAAQLAGQGAAGTAGAEQAAPAAEVAGTRCEELVERILVSRPSADGREEVRIRLDRSWLPDTEVSMVRTPGEGLSVEFVSDRVEAQRFLLPNLSGLRERLSERTGDQVAVRMSEHAGSATDAGDGRSRERRNLWDEMKEK